MCLPPKKSKIKANRVWLKNMPPPSLHSRPRPSWSKWQNEETGLVRAFYPAPRRGKWKRLPWPQYGREG